MITNKYRNRSKVRAERVDTICGYVGHMTVDDIKARSYGENVNVTCPECGKIHLTLEEVEEAEATIYRRSKRYAKIKSEAESG
ncbi:MAG: hypothetical protein AAGU11_14295 [Syntrophobacteraceae bacterium]